MNASLDAPDPVRERALTMLAEFRERVLPGFLRRSHAWSGFDSRRHADVVDDIVQELALDCLAHAETVVALDPRDRHRRWLQLAQRHHYELRTRAQRRRAGDETCVRHVTAAPSALRAALDRRDVEVLDALVSHAEFLGNGRLCVAGTASAMAIGRARLRQLTTRIACALGIDASHLSFWRRRLAEAACALAAARLRDGGQLRLWDDAARRPVDDRAFRRRLGRIRAALSLRPLDSDLRREIDTLAPRASLPVASPRELLALAEEIAPDVPAIPQWRFEAELLRGDLAAAADSLRRASRLEPDRVRLALARARLAEARGRPDAARRSLVRAVVRHGADPRLRASLQALGGGVRRRAPSATHCGPAQRRSHSA